MKALIKLQLPSGKVQEYQVETDSLEAAQAAAKWADEQTHRLFAMGFGESVANQFGVLSVEEITDGAVS